MSKIKDILIDELADFEQKNELLCQYGEELEPLEFYRLLFPVGSFERKGHQEDRKGNGFVITVSTDATGNKTVRRNLVTDDLDFIKDTLDSCTENDFCIMSPVSYAGRSRKASNARYLFAMALDIDGVTSDTLSNFFNVMNFFDIPMPTFIVNSGHGVHFYYQFEHPIPMYPGYQRVLKALKDALLPRIWNKYTSIDEKVQFQSIVQGFRMPGTYSKFGTKIRVWQYGEPVQVKDLIAPLEKFDFDIKGLDDERQMTLAEAKQKYPEWYQTRIIEKQPRKRWVVKRDLYDWWKRQILLGATVGHRYFTIMVLAIYAKKCEIEFEELENDAYSFINALDSLGGVLEPFTEDDVNKALEAYHENYVTFPIEAIEKITNISIKRNKRNGRTQEMHLKGARAIRDINNINWREGNGRKAKDQIIAEWRINNPNGTKYRCIKDTGLDKKTVYKWWDAKLKEKPIEY